MNPRDFQKMLRELLDTEEGLSEWEIGFIDSLKDQGFAEDRLDFTPRQRKKLEEIWLRMFRQEACNV